MKGKKGELKIKLIRSPYGCKKDQIGTVRALGLKRINQVITIDDNPVMRGMLFKVKHLVEIL